MLFRSKQLDELLEKEFIRPSSSPWGCPVIFVKKRVKRADILDLTCPREEIQQLTRGRVLKNLLQRQAPEHELECDQSSWTSKQYHWLRMSDYHLNMHPQHSRARVARR